MNKTDEKYWADYLAHVLSLTVYYCPRCGLVRLKKKAGQTCLWCVECQKKNDITGWGTPELADDEPK